MCGRVTQTASPEVIAQQFELTDPPLFAPRYNIAPSQPVAAIRIDPDTTTRTLVMLRWGLIPSWAKDPKIGSQCINAKAETVLEKPSFRAAFKIRRCLVIATRFYEWRVQRLAKQPMWIGLKS
jgi:putative SOS response-associated peptidase YedK